jgi:hypothetical protein
MGAKEVGCDGASINQDAFLAEKSVSKALQAMLPVEVTSQIIVTAFGIEERQRREDVE